jgi:uncharacterized membrane protein YgdD (TMEM256/DUF423 family)
MDRIWLIWAGFHGFISVAFGAFGAHLLKESLTPDRLDVVATAARYQMYSALALLALAALPKKENSKTAGWCLALGALIFSGSLYAYALTGAKALGVFTPLGGVSLLVGWALLFKKGWRPTSI